MMHNEISNEKTPPFLFRTTDVTTLYPPFCAKTFFPFWDALYLSFCATASKWGAFFFQPRWIFSLVSVFFLLRKLFGHLKVS